MRHTLINPNQCRHFGSKVQDNPYHEYCPMLIESPERIIYRMLAVCWNRYVRRYFVSHAGRPWVLSTHLVNVLPTLESTKNWVSTNKIFCARRVRGAKFIKDNNMLLGGDTWRYISPTIWGYQRWLQKSQQGGSFSCRHGQLPQASCIWCSCHRDTCVSYIDRKYIQEALNISVSKQ